ncbi:MAG: methyltransferase [Hyphomicrobiaceae bacterium]|nr:methyltransferase [Hyphomicrobiaceae bacterium]
MSLETASVEVLPWVKAELNYLVPTRERPRTYTYDPPAGVPRSTAANEPHIVQISDVRPILSEVSLDTHGFDLVPHLSAVRHFYNEQEVKAVYYPEAEQLLKDVTGADRVFIFDNTVRRRVPGAQDRLVGQPRQPVPRVHVDHTETSGPQRVRDLLPEQAEQLLRGRVEIINLWRPIRGPLLDMPLAVADAKSVKPEQLIASDLVYQNRVGETYSVTYDARHRWYYVPRMEADEVLLLKCYDSKSDGRARFTPHTAFADPTTPIGAPPRESIELRAMVFHTA